ncbi:MAG: ribonuclease HII [Patescibacteria group bacterium]
MRYIIGIDEVGRGALAGPVTVAAVCIPANRKSQIANRSLGKLKDSKKLSAKQREVWFEYFDQHPALHYGVARVFPRQIEKRNISGAANLAALRAYNKLNSKFPARLASQREAGRQIPNSKVFLDGGLYLGNNRRITQNVRRTTQKKFQRKSALSQRWSARTIVRGDEKIKAIAAASIIAKVTRDRAMVRLAKAYPQYGFEIHKGYGTKAHMRAIKRHGPSEAHRSTFLGKHAKIKF